MSDRSFTLLDIQRGMWKLKLHSVLNEEFKLLWGLVMTANDLGFKNPIELVNQDAMVLAKVNSREMLRRRRNALAKVRVYGNWILKYTKGNGWQTQCGKYEINYDFLVSAVRPWNGDNTDLNDTLSTDIDRGVDRKGREVLTEVLTTPRSDQKREEDIRSGDDNNFGDKPTEKESTTPTINADMITLGKAVLSKWSHQLASEPPDSHCRQVLESVDGDIDKLLEAINRAPATLKDQNGTKPNSKDALAFVLTVAQHPTWYVYKSNTESGDISYAKKDEARAKIKELEELHAEASASEDTKDHFPLVSKEEFLVELTTELERLRGIK